MNVKKKKSDTLFSIDVFFFSRLKLGLDHYFHLISSNLHLDACSCKLWWMDNVPSVLKACGALLDSSYGRVVHGSVEVSSYRCSLYVCNTLISMYTRFGNVDIGWRLFDMMSERNTVKRNTLVKCYASQGKWEEAFKFFL